MQKFDDRYCFRLLDEDEDVTMIPPPPCLVKFANVALTLHSLAWTHKVAHIINVHKA